MQIVPPAFIHASRESLPGGFGRISRLPSASWEIQHAPRVQVIREREGTGVQKSYSQGEGEDDTTTWSEEKLKLADTIRETTWDYFDLLSMRVGNVSSKFIAKFKGGDIPSEFVLGFRSMQKLLFCNTVIFIAKLFFQASCLDDIIL